MNKVALAVLALAAVSCSTAAERRAALQQEQRVELTTLYPQGLPWHQPDAAYGTFAVWRVGDPPPDGHAEYWLEHARQLCGDVESCRWGWMPRLTAASSMFGMTGIYIDYVFLDSHDRVIAAYRRFLD